jgi:N-acetylglucosaminyl-diphospho-decaprenol L-rhamnosyltransferase
MSSGPSPDLSVIIVTHNGRDMALRTLRSAIAHAGSAATEWIVVDCGSTDGTPDAVAEEFPEVWLFRRPNIGFAAGNNVALPYARGRYVLLLNPDVEIQRGTLADLVAALDERPEVGAASIVHLDEQGRLLYSARRFSTPLRKLGEALAVHRWTPLETLQEADTCAGHYRDEHSADWVVGAFIAVRREALEQVGPLDERFFLYAEEKDWCRRIRQAGWDVRHLPHLTMVHFGAERGRPELVAQLSYSNLLFAQKHLGRVGALGFWLALLAGHVARMTAMIPGALFRCDTRERLRGQWLASAVLLGLVRPPFEAAAAAGFRALSRPDGTQGGAFGGQHRARP